MKILALAVLLAAVQAGPPIPRKASNANAGSNKTVQYDPSNQKTPSSTASPVTSNENQNTTKSPTDANTQETIVIRELAPVPPAGADWWFRTYVIFTGALVAIGAAGIFYAIKTLNAIKRQARANEDQLMEIQQSAEKTDRMISIAAQQAENSRIATEAAKRSADAALLNAKAVINAERPWIVISASWVKELPHGFRISIKNLGRTPAYILSCSSEHPVLKKEEGLQPKPVYPKDAETKLSPFSTLIMPDREETLADHALDDIPGWNWQKMLFAETFLYLYGRVVYSDHLGEEKGDLSDGEPYETRWCFFVNATNPLSFVRDGPDEYNSYK